MIINKDPKWVEIESDGEATGTKYHGRFLLKPFLSHREKADAARLAEKYCRGIFQSESIRLFLTTMAFLKFHIVECDADWWTDENGEDGLNIVDENPVYEISAKLYEIQHPEEKKKKDESKDK